jgi:hypothetical protein
LEVYFPSFLHLDIFIFIGWIYEMWYVCVDSIADIGPHFPFCYFQERDIPVLIFSAGLADIIEEVRKVNFVLRVLSISLYFLGCYWYLIVPLHFYVPPLQIIQVLRQKLHRSFKNVKIVSNRMVFNDDGQLVSFKGDSMLPTFISSVIWYLDLHIYSCVSLYP